MEPVKSTGPHGTRLVFVSTPNNSADLMAEQWASDAHHFSKLKLEVFSECKLLWDKMVGELEDNIQTLLRLGGNGGDSSWFWPSSRHSFKSLAVDCKSHKDSKYILAGIQFDMQEIAGSLTNRAVHLFNLLFSNCTYCLQGDCFSVNILVPGVDPIVEWVHHQTLSKMTLLIMVYLAISPSMD